MYQYCFAYQFYFNWTHSPINFLSACNIYNLRETRRFLENKRLFCLIPNLGSYFRLTGKMDNFLHGCPSVKLWARQNLSGVPFASLLLVKFPCQLPWSLNYFECVCCRGSLVQQRVLSLESRDKIWAWLLHL